MDFSQILPYLPYVFTGLFVLVMLGSVLFALIRGLSKARIRFIILAVCLLLSFVAVWVFKNSASTMYPQLETALQQALTSEQAMEAYEVISGSEPLKETVLGFASALVAPLLFLVVFIALRIVSWFIYFIVTLVIGGKLKQNDAKQQLRGLRVLALGILQGLLIFFVLMTPIYAYLTVAAPAMEVAMQTTENANVNEGTPEPEQSEGVALIQQSPTGVLAYGNPVQFTLNDQVDMNAINQLLESVQSNFFFSMYGKLGGNLTCNFLTEFTSGGEKTNVVNEMKAISALAAEAMKLKDVKGVEDLDEEKAAVIGNLVGSIGESKMMQTVIGELLYAVTDAWKNDQTVFGAEKPKLDPVIEPLFTTILDDFHKDARTPGQISEDLKTLGEMITVLAKSDMLKELSGENPDSDKLIETFAQGSLVKDLISALGKNSTLKNLIPEMANVGMRALGSSVLNLPENAEEIFQNYLEEIAAAVNEVLAAEATYEEKVDMLAAKMIQAVNDSGLTIDLDEAVAKLYSDAILSDIHDAGLTQITADDVRDFFEIAAEQYEEDRQNTAPLAATFGTSEKAYRGTLYGNKTKSEISGSAVVKLVVITKEIAKASEEATDEEGFQAKLAIITEQHSVSVDLTNLSKDAFTQETLKAVSSIKEESFPTTLITVEALLIDTQKVTDQINENTIEAEADKIGKIFNTAVKVKDAFADSEEGFNMDKLVDIAADLGEILDSIESTETFDGKTALVITAVFQKEEVTESLNVDIRTATELAKAATETVNGVETNYTATMESVSTGAAIAQKLSDPEGKITEDDVETLLRTMTPQTANMLKVYLTDERVKSFGISDRATNAAARILRALFEEMADKEKYTDYSGETAAMLKMFEVAKTAGKGENHGSLFNHGEDEGALHLTAMGTVELVMDSNMVRNAIVKAMYVNGEIDPEMVNPFGLKIPTEESDYQECEAAIEEYYGTHPETKTFLKAIAALFGVEAAFLN